MENGRFYARVSIACYKPGMREKGDKIVEELLKQWYGGYRGYIIQSSLEDPDTSIYMTFWNTREDMMKATGEISDETFRALEELSLGIQAVHLTEVRDHWLHLEPE